MTNTIKLIGTVVLIFTLFACGSTRQLSSSVDNLEIMLTDGKGQGLEQVSGLTQFENYLFFVAQKHNSLFYIDTETALAAMKLGLKFLALEQLELTGQLPAEGSWEAVTIASVGGKDTVFLSYEHLGGDAANSAHKVYSGEVELRGGQPTLSKFRPFSQALPIAVDTRILSEDRTNFGYEAVTWSQRHERLLLVPELTGLSALLIADEQAPNSLFTGAHGLRISDLTQLTGSQCLLGVSFCYRDDPICHKNGSESALSLAMIELHQNSIKVTDVYDISDKYLEIDSLNGTQKGVYNAEGITQASDMLFMINDNKPGVGVGTVLKTMSLPLIQNENCAFSPTS